MNRVLLSIRRMVHDERGSVPVEYGMIAVLISIIAVGAMTSIGTKTNLNFSGVIAGLK
jgi:pilus assembly protein Flp/PilA